MKVQKQTKPLLKRLTEFESVLKDYHPSAESLKTLSATKLILMVGPTASGRNTLINLLVQTGRYHYVVSDTTRPPRSNNGVMEQDGHEYWFKSEDEFLERLKEGKYLEAAVIHRQQVSGISVAELDRAHAMNKIAIDEVENEGTANVHQYKPDTLNIFLLPPSFNVWMERLRNRGGMEEAEMKRRLESAIDEITTALKEDYYTFVINYEIHKAAEEVDKIATSGLRNAQAQDTAKAHAKQLAIDVRQYLNA